MNEINLIDQCLRNDRRAQKELVYNYAPALLSVIRRYVTDVHRAEDYLQEGFINIFNNLQQFDHQKASLYTWMRKIVIHTTFRQFQMEKSRLNGIQVLEESQALSIPETEISLQHLDSEYLIKLIQKLEDPYRKIFNLHAIDGYTHEEVAEILGIEVVTSRSYLFRARKLLMQQLLAQKASANGK
ncbi:MAG: RNA polymerase sigma factor [Saprospiraceae bacterium]|nr:RNA polymerase sigma factor [Saprospiraceae bacterium]